MAPSFGLSPSLVSLEGSARISKRPVPFALRYQRGRFRRSGATRRVEGQPPMRFIHLAPRADHPVGQTSRVARCGAGRPVENEWRYGSGGHLRASRSDGTLHSAGGDDSRANRAVWTPRRRDCVARNEEIAYVLGLADPYGDAQVDGARVALPVLDPERSSRFARS